MPTPAFGALTAPTRPSGKFMMFELNQPPPTGIPFPVGVKGPYIVQLVVSTHIKSEPAEYPLSVATEVPPPRKRMHPFVNVNARLSEL